MSKFQHYSNEFSKAGVGIPRIHRVGCRRGQGDMVSWPEHAEKLCYHGFKQMTIRCCEQEHDGSGGVQSIKVKREASRELDLPRCSDSICNTRSTPNKPLMSFFLQQHNLGTEILVYTSGAGVTTDFCVILLLYVRTLVQRLSTSV